jgi:hypothetical protein
MNNLPRFSPSPAAVFAFTSSQVPQEANMKSFTTILAAACLVGALGGAAVAAHAQGDWEWRGDHWVHRDWRAEREWRWRHRHDWDRNYSYRAPAPRYYGYYNPPPVYYAPPGATFGYAVP